LRGLKNNAVKQFEKKWVFKQKPCIVGTPSETETCTHDKKTVKRKKMGGGGIVCTHEEQRRMGGGTNHWNQRWYGGWGELVGAKGQIGNKREKKLMLQ